MTVDSDKNTPRQLTFRLNLDDDATFANFYIKDADSSSASVAQYLRQAVSRFVSSREQSGSGTVLSEFIWLFGAQGAGCSHLLQAVCHDIDALGLQSFYLDFSVQTGLTPDVLQELESVTVLCLDSVELLQGRPEWERELFNLYNRMAESNTPLIVASKTSPKYLNFELADLNSRMQSAAVFQLDSLSDEDKAAALKLRARRRGFELSDEVATYLVSRSERSMSSLFEVLQKLDQHSLETRRKVTLPLLKTMMKW
ncbi:MAG: DnaA regulatory inactivator Hda [Pseudohongiella sp.]|nr:DnaA regulatory inactivator Hda [Pseudohongiella sp.]MDO9521628.1 DnaA regulatory inactivator Hda [Pseudohongiella sp.]MDP2127855.1 DnaA regulatory inactivator Hda [Pseudohongiella sp.]